MPLLDEIKEALQKEDFSSARRRLKIYLAEGGLEPGQLIWARQKLALSTYKNKEIQSEAANLEALDILKGLGLGQDQKDTETLGQAGACNKRLWEITRDVKYLTKSVAFYKRVQEEALATRPEPDLEKWAYGAVNAAFVLDIHAAEEPAEAAEYRSEADALRREVCDRREELLAVKGSDDIPWWLRASVIESHFGIGELDRAATLLSESLAVLKPDEWKRETMARQLANIARLRCEPERRSEAYDVISPLFGTTSPFVARTAATALLNGRVGLALSGGGFRAALFHVGVLARLAEFDVLRHVEALSCVSGGSILGMLYYLELRRELMQKTDHQMTQQVYLAIVDRVQDKLIAALKNDIRTKAMLTSLPTRRTVRAGQLIGAALYADYGIADGLMRELTIQPMAEAEGFHPRRHNWRRSAKAPILIINATTLNTGHNWQFTASYMGEAPTCIEPAVDSSERLRRMYYSEAPQPHGDVEIHTAVSASAAVPGVFWPIKLKGLYPRRVVRLSDGGVHDNQGLFGLVEQDCNIVLVSDACGQLDSISKPRPWAFRVLMRSTDVLMETVRRNLFRLSAQQFHNSRLRAFHFMHLKRGLPTIDITWVRGFGRGQAVPRDAELSRLNEQIQRAVANIRTDLDSFSENECHALMFAGYRIASRDFDGDKTFTGAADRRWKFLRVESWMDERTAAAAAPPSFVDELECGQYKFFRRIRLSKLGRAWRRWRAS
jgi:predicted acylesterase/phospholipase RssA